MSLVAVSSGIFAALASVCAKSASEPRFFLQFLDNEEWIGMTAPGVRFFFIGLTILTNITMWVIFTYALNASESSVQATVINSASNFFFSAIFGFIFFGEPLSFQWFIGSCFILGGVLLMHQSYEQKKKKKKDTSKKKTN